MFSPARGAPPPSRATSRRSRRWRCFAGGERPIASGPPSHNWPPAPSPKWKYPSGSLFRGAARRPPRSIGPADAQAVGQVPMRRFRPVGRIGLLEVAHSAPPARRGTRVIISAASATNVKGNFLIWMPAHLPWKALHSTNESRRRSSLRIPRAHPRPGCRTCPCAHRGERIGFDAAQPVSGVRSPRRFQRVERLVITLHHTQTVLGPGGRFQILHRIHRRLEIARGPALLAQLQRQRLLPAAAISPVARPGPAASAAPAAPSGRATRPVRCGQFFRHRSLRPWCPSTGR